MKVNNRRTKGLFCLRSGDVSARLVSVCGDVGASSTCNNNKAFANSPLRIDYTRLVIDTKSTRSPTQRPKRIARDPVKTGDQKVHEAQLRRRHIHNDKHTRPHNMGGYLSSLSKLVWAKKEIRILILGLVCCVVGNHWQPREADCRTSRTTPERQPFSTGSRYVGFCF